MGLWMIQSVKKEWKEELSFAQICEQASKEEITLVDCNDDCFLAPKEHDRSSTDVLQRE